MCLHGKIAWNRLLICSAKMILKKFKISQGVLLIDDKNHERSKKTEKIHGFHKQKNKKTEGLFIRTKYHFVVFGNPIFLPSD